MNKILLFSVFLFITASSFAQKDTTRSEQEVKTLLCHKWKVTHIEMNGQKIPLPPELGESSLEIIADGTLIEKDATEEIKGKWSYDHKTKILTTDDRDGIIKHVILKISETELIFKSEVDGTEMNLIMKRLD